MTIYPGISKWDKTIKCGAGDPPLPKEPPPPPPTEPQGQPEPEPEKAS